MRHVPSTGGKVTQSVQPVVESAMKANESTNRQQPGRQRKHPSPRNHQRRDAQTPDQACGGLSVTRRHHRAVGFLVFCSGAEAWRVRRARGSLDVHAAVAAGERAADHYLRGLETARLVAEAMAAAGQMLREKIMPS